MLVSAVDRRLLPALRFVSRLPFAEARAVHVSFDADVARRVAEDWIALDLTWLPLHIVEGDSRDIPSSVIALASETAAADGPLTVVVPELDIAHWWHPLLHRRTARRIAADLQRRPGVTAVIVPFAIE